MHWGYWMFYAQYGFHHADYCWDGGVAAADGRIVNCALIAYDGISGRFGPSHERLVQLKEPRWRWRSQHAGYRLGGALFEVEGNPQTVVRIRTRTADLDFTLSELIEKRHILKHVGGRYSNVNLEVSFDGEDFRNWSARDLAAQSVTSGRWKTVVYASEFGCPTHRIQLSEWAVIEPGESIDIPLPLPQWQLAGNRGMKAVRVLLSAIARNLEGKSAAIEYSADFQGRHIARSQHTFQVIGHSNDEIVGVEELEFEVPGTLFLSTDTILAIRHVAGSATLAIGRVWLEELPVSDVEISVCPKWVVLNRCFVVELRCRGPLKDVRVELPDGVRCADKISDSLRAGNHRFKLQATLPLSNAVIRFASSSGTCEEIVEQVFSAEPETFPMRVGTDNVVFPPTVPEKTNVLFKYMTDRQMCDHYSFRSKPSFEVLQEWINQCRTYGIHYSVEHDVEPRFVRKLKLQEDPLFTAGYRLTECDGPIFGYNQFADISGRLLEKVTDDRRTMRTAYEAFEEYWRQLKKMRSDVFGPGVEVWGHVSTISHYACYRAGLPVCVTQLNKSHNVLLLSEARGAARAFNATKWATYIAEGAHVSPEGDQHLRMWWLALYLSYVVGASFADDEQHLFRTWHEFLYGPHDRDIQIRQRIAMNFNRYIKTHPRRGELKVKQAVLIGRYACDVADGLCAHPDNPRTFVWRNFGGTGNKWYPGTPEYGLRCIDAFFPGVWLHSLYQSPETVRRWYSGSPFGETELIPIDSPPAVLKSYDLLLLLGWNTMDEAQYEELKTYVRSGGTLFMAVPHATTNEGREFLSNGLQPMNLVRGGNFRDLFGVTVKGPGSAIRAIRPKIMPRNPCTLAGMPVDSTTSFRRLPAMPPHAPARSAELELCGAEVLAEEEESGEPLLVRFSIGKGEAYLLSTWEYPGNSWISTFATNVIAGLAGNIDRDVQVQDDTGDVYYTVREEAALGLTRIHMLNTDWSSSGNEKYCRVRLGEYWIDVTVREGRLTEIIWKNEIAVLVEDPRFFVDRLEKHDDLWIITVHGYGEGTASMQRLNGSESTWKVMNISFEHSSILKAELPI